MRHLLPQFRNIATRTAFWFCLLLGAVVVGRGIQLGYPSLHLVLNGVRGEGKIVANHGAFPEIQFHTDSDTFNFTSRTGSQPPEFSVGETAPILYDAQFPDEYAVIRSFDDMWLWPGVVAGFGLAIILGTLLVASAHKVSLAVLISLLPGVVVLCASVAGLGTPFRLARHGVTVEGKVAKVNDALPLVEFQGPNGTPIRFIGASGDFLDGQAVAVIYDPDHPQHALIRSQMWSNSVLGIGIGLALTVAPLLFTYFFFRKPEPGAGVAISRAAVSGWAVLFGMAAIVVLGGAIWSLNKALHAESYGVQTAGRVILDSYDGGDYYPVVEFRTADGKAVRFRGPIGSDPASYAEGEAVIVLYPPQHPEEAMIRGFQGLWLRPVAFAGVAFILAFVAFVCQQSAS
jgi:Protein of unknown function (DUF3592)